ncbi:MAG: DEAD/DEAH box helicase [Propionibacteriaceae bacterium]|jgi:superfamily II DNA or RNA helicase|nr:DEAD/DEAH box helicase [Propionibacteriaceae bacterium]
MMLPLTPVDQIFDLTGPAAFARGEVYARSGHVDESSVAWDDDARRLSGRVKGNRPTPYTVVVYYADRGEGLRPTASRCSCPVGLDCKHVAALLLAAHSLAERSTDGISPRHHLTADSPAWQRILTSTLGAGRRAGPAPTASDIEPLAVQIDVAADTRSGSTGFGHLALARIVKPGRASKPWITSDLSWDDISRGSIYARHYPPRAMAWLTTLTRLFYPHIYGRPTWLDLGIADGTLLFDVLRRAEEAGVPLVGTNPPLPVGLAEQATLTLDVAATPEGAWRLTASPRFDEMTAEADALASVGGGLAATIPEEEGCRIWLGPLATPVTPALTSLVASLPLTIPSEGSDDFARDYLPALRRLAPVGNADGSLTLPEPISPVLVLTVAARRDETAGEDSGATPEASLAWSWDYAGATADPAAPAEDDLARDPMAEEAILERIRPLRQRWGFLGDPRRGTHPRLGGFDIVTLAHDALPVLEATEGVRVAVDGEMPTPQELTEAPRLTIAATADSDVHDWLDLEVIVEVGGRHIPFAALFQALARDEEFLLLPDATYLRLDQPEFTRLRALIEEARRLSDSPSRTRVSPYQASLLWDLEDLADEIVIDPRHRATLEALRQLTETGATPVPVEPSPHVEATLRDYQRRALDWLAFCHKHRLGGVLADDMGLGKTLEALALIQHVRDHEDVPAREDDSSAASGPATTSTKNLTNPADPSNSAHPSSRLASDRRPFLVVTPASVVGTWVDEARRFTPQLDIRPLTNTRKRDGVPMREAIAGADVVVTSYTLFRLDSEDFIDQDWAGLLLDEAQFAKNPATQVNQVARKLDAPFKLAITGTPMENNLTELWAILAIVAPGFFPSLKHFREDYVKPITGDDVEARRSSLTLLRRRLRPLLLRRTKEQVAPELPPRIEQVVHVDLADKHRRIYDTVLQRERSRMLGLLDDFEANRFEIFRTLTLLRRLALDASLVDERNTGVPSSKLDVLFENLEDVLGSGHRALIFSQFTSYLKLIAQRCDEEKVAYAYLDGATTHRDQVIRGFREGDAPLFLISLKAGGFGLTLTEADYVFLMDPWWNPATENQAIDRTHRIGQTRPVLVTRLVAERTIEEKVMALKESKAALFDAIMDDQAFSGSLTADDIRGLLDV